MNHLTEEQLILHYYGEEGRRPRRRAAPGRLPGMPRDLQLAAARVERGRFAARAGARPGIWRRSLAPHRASRFLRAGAGCPSFEWRWAAAGRGMAGLLIAAFLAGASLSAGRPPAASDQLTAAADPQAGERVLLVAVGDYLERSQMVLIELANADPKGKLDISNEQERAADLVSESRLYRQTAEHTGDTAVAGVLDELDRVLLDIARGPSEVSPAELETCASGSRPKAFCSRFGCWDRKSALKRKDAPPATKRPACAVKEGKTTMNYSRRFTIACRSACDRVALAAQDAAPPAPPAAAPGRRLPRPLQRPQRRRERPRRCHRTPPMPAAAPAPMQLLPGAAGSARKIRHGPGSGPRDAEQARELAREQAREISEEAREQAREMASKAAKTCASTCARPSSDNWATSISISTLAAAGPGGGVG